MQWSHYNIKSQWQVMITNSYVPLPALSLVIYFISLPFKDGGTHFTLPPPPANFGQVPKIDQIINCHYSFDSGSENLNHVSINRSNE